MGILGTVFDSGSPMPWDLGEVPGRKPSLRLEDIYDITQNAEAKYPESVWAPPPDIGRGPDSNPYPEPYEFRKRELVAACRQAMKLNGMGERYPRPWTINDEATDYMAFPILPGKRLWAGEEPGRFRIVYNKFNGAFYRVVMHRYTTPLARRESAGLGFCWDGERCGQESMQSALGERRRLSKSPPEISHSLDDTKPHPLRQNPTQAKAPSVITSQFNNISSLDLNADRSLVKSPPTVIQSPSNVQSPSFDQDIPVVRSPPPLRQRAITVKSPRPLTSKFSATKSPAIGLETDLVTSPPLTTRQISSVQSPVIDQKSYDPRLPRSPHLAGSSFRIIRSPVLRQGSPTIRSPPMTPEAFSNIQSHIKGYDPRLPRSPRLNTHPFNNSQSSILGQESPPARSPAIGLHPSRFVQSPVLGQDPRLIKSPPVAQMARWMNAPEARRASHA